MSVRNRERPAGRLLGPRTRAPTSPLPAPPAQLTQPQAFVPPPPPPPPQPQSQPEPSNEERNGETNGVDGRRSEDRPSYFESQDAYARNPDPVPQPQPQPQPVPQPEAQPSSSLASPEIQRKDTQDAPSSSSAAPLIRRDTTASLGPPAYTAHPPQQQPQQPRAPPPLSPTHVHGQLPSIPPPPPLQPQQNISMQPPTSATGATFLHPGPPRSPAGTNGSLPSVPPTPTTPAHTHNSGPSRPSTSASSYTNTGTATTNSTLSAPTLQPAPAHFHSQAQRPGTATQVKRSAPARPPLPPLPQIELNPAPIPYKHLTLDAAQWTLSSSDLQALVSAAIRESARERSIRLLAPNVQAEIDRRLNELEREWDTAASGWRFEGMRRGNILSALQSIASSLPSSSTNTSIPFPTGTGTLGGTPSSEDDGEALHALLSQLHAAMGRMDAHAGSLLAAAHAKAGCERAVGTHKSSALAVALRKLNASYARRTKELGRERERRLVAEGEVDEAWRVAEEVAAEVDRLRAEKRAWEERERELTDALSAFSTRPAPSHRRGDSAATATGEGLRFVLTTEGEGEGGEEDTMNRRLSLASEDLTSVSRMSRISHISKAEVVPVTGKAVISAARYVAPLPDNTKEAKEDGDGGEPPSPVSEGFREGEGPTALIPKPGESEVGGSSVAASVGHGSDAEDEQTVEAPEKQSDEPATARPFPSTSTFKLPPAPSNSPPVPPPHVDPVLPSSHPRPHITPAPDRPEHKRHKRASTTSQVSRVSAARTRSMRASKASLGLSVRGKGVVGGAEGAGEGRRVRRRASSVSSVPESGYGVEIRKERRRRGSFTLPAAATSSKVTAQDGEKGKEAGKGRERKDSDAFSIASASSAAASVQSRRREKERERMKAPPPVPALPVGEDEGSFLELGMIDQDAGEGEEGEGEKSAVLGEGASALFRFSAPAPQHSYPPRAEPLSTPSTSTATSTTSKPRRPRSPTTLTLLSAFVSTPTSENPPDEDEDGPGMSPAAASSVAPFANVAPINTSTQEGANGSTDILPSMSSSTSAHTPASEHPPEPQPESAVRLTTKLSIPHASGSGLPSTSTSMGAGSAGSPLSPGGGLAYLHTPASPAGPRPPGTIGHAHIRGVSAPGPRVLNSSTMPSRSVHVRPGSSAGEAAFSRPKFGTGASVEGASGKGQKERTLQHSASQPLSGVVSREEPKGAALRHSSAESGALPLVRSGTFGKVDGVARMGVDSPEIMQGKEEEAMSVEQAEDFSSSTPSAQGPGPSSSPPMPSPVHSLNPSTSSGPHPYAPSPAQLNHAHSGSLASTRSSLGVVLENGTPDEFGLHMHSSSSSPVLRPSRSGTFNLTRYAAPNSALEDDMWARGASDEWSRDGLSFDSGASASTGVGKGAGGGGGADGEEVTATSPLVPRRGHSLELPQGGSSDGGARVRRSMSELLRFGLIGRRRPGSSGGGGSKSGVLGGGGGGGKTPVKESKDEDAEGILG